MRQLVSVVNEDHVLYFVHDGDEVEQVATVKNPGLDVRDVIGLGTTLAALYQPPTPAPVVRAVSNGHARALPAPRQRPERKPRPYFATSNLVAIVRGHPRSTARQITQMALPPNEPMVKGLVEHVQTKLGPLVTAGVLRAERVESRTFDGRQLRGLLHYSVPEQT